MYDISPQQKSQLNLRIALWGPQDSGKTWFIHALPKILELYNRADPDFFYDLTDAIIETKKPIQSTVYFSTRTTNVTNYYYQFQRRAKQKTIANTVSVHTHYLDIQDMAGYSTVTMDEQAQIIYRDSHLIIIMLDPTLLSTFHKDGSVESHKTVADDEEFDLSLLFDEPNQEQERFTTSTKISPKEYAEYVNNLFGFLSKQPDSHPQVAICLSKSDLWRRSTTGNDLLLSTGFGLEMKSVLDRYKTRFAIQHFTISSMGYLPGSKQENYSLETGKPLNLSVWQPINVEKPLFWLLEKQEKQKLAQKGGLMGIFFRDENLRMYKPYIRLDNM